MVSILSFTKHALNTLAFALLAQGFAIPDGLEKRDGAGVITLDFDVVRNPLDVNLTQFVDGDLAKRDYIPLTLQERSNTIYTTNITVGSNKQKQSVYIDTGSSDLWVVDVNAQCKQGVACKIDGTFNPKTSTTFQNLTTPFAVTYGSRNLVEGSWVKDTVGFGGISITNQQFGDATKNPHLTGILGLGFKDGEVSARYDNVPITLKKQGYIKTNAYSLYLNSPGAATGQLIFGGVDNAKYSGNLIAEPVTEGDQLLIILDTINYTGASFTYNGHVLVDSGTALTYISPKFAAQIAKQAGATLDPSGSGGRGSYYIECDAPVSGTVDFTFAKGSKITVPLSEFVSGFHVGKNKCQWGIQPSFTQFGLLGDNVMRHAYLLFNLDAQTISIAQVKYTTDSDIVAV